MASKEYNINIVFAGKGKCELFKNIFGQEMLTKELSSTSFEWTTKMDTITLHITTCSSGDEDDKMKLEAFKEKYGKADLLIYCMPVDPGTRFDELNPDIILCIQNVLGKEVWKHCVVAATFSNQTWKYTHDENNPNDAKNQFKHHINEFSKLFRYELNSSEVDAKSIFNYAPLLKSGEASDKYTIPVIPAGRNAQDEVLPGIALKGEWWADEIFIEMKNKCRDNSKKALEECRKENTEVKGT